MGNGFFDTKNVENVSVGEVSPSQAWDLLKKDPNAVLVDVRTMPEWMFVGVVNLSSLKKEVVYISWREYPAMDVNDNFAKQLIDKKNIDEDTPILFICKVGGRSFDAAVEMAKHGYSNCLNVLGGFEGDLDDQRHRGNKNGWKSCNLPWEQR